MPRDELADPFSHFLFLVLGFLAAVIAFLARAKYRDAAYHARLSQFLVKSDSECRDSQVSPSRLYLLEFRKDANLSAAACHDGEDPAVLPKSIR